MSRFLDEITEDQRKSVLEIFNHSEKSFQESQVSLGEWFDKQPHLPRPNDKNAKMAYFLLLARGRIEHAKIKIDDYYTFWTKVPQIFQYVNPNKEVMRRYIEDVINCAVMPKITHDLCRVTVIQGNDFDPLKFDLYKTFAVTLAVAEMRCIEDWVAGNVLIIDLQGLIFGHVTKITPLMLKTVAVIGQKMFGSSKTTIHLLNHKPMVHKIVSLMKSFLNPKVAERVFLEESLDSLQHNVGKEFLPVDYGGAQPSIREIKERIVNKFEEMSDHFDHLDTLKVKESLRPFENRTIDELFGANGHFRKLDID